MDEEITDPCYLMGKKHLEHDIKWTEMINNRTHGCLILQKAIMNDYWADCSCTVPGHTGWEKEHVDMVMSKLYYCWVRMSMELQE